MILAVASVAATLMLNATTTTPATRPGRAVLVAEKKQAAPQKEEEEAEAEADEGGSGGKVWFAFWKDDYRKPVLEDRAILLDLVGWFFFEIGGAIWGPMLLVGAPFSLDWALPVLVWMGVAWGCLAVAGMFSWTGLGLLMVIPAFIAAYIGVEVMLANLDRPDIKLGAEEKEAPAEAPKKKK